MISAGSEPISVRYHKSFVLKVSNMTLDMIGVLPKKEKQFEKAGITSIETLLQYFPIDYRDYSKSVLPGDLYRYDGRYVMTVGNIISAKVVQGQHALCTLQGGDGETFNVLWFNQAYRVQRLNKGRACVVAGQCKWNPDFSSATFAVPEIFESAKDVQPGIYPIYKKIPGMADDYLRSAIDEALLWLDACVTDYMSETERRTLGIESAIHTVRMAHHPKCKEDVKRVKRRGVVDELFPFCMGLDEKAYYAAKKSPFVPKKADEAFAQIQKNLPYTLTKDQNDAVSKFLTTMKKGHRVDALLQGDVGCGKTVVAVILSAAMAMSGYQTAVMCPTSVLASQHLQEFTSLLTPLGITVDFVHSGMKAKERRELISNLESGKTKVLVGTHAAFSKDIKFKDLALTIIDEEHRFGVEQREALREKAADGVHCVSMSATPIPRTIAVALYGEGTEVVNIVTKPAGRKPVVTILYSNEPKVYQSMYNQIREGRQCYVICPLIEESTSDKLAGVDSVEQTLEKMKEWYKKYPEVKIGALTGKMKEKEIQERIDEFASGKIQIIISTTVVEVGVNVPNATVIMIKNAERFGLAQLHQLRGRVGRSDFQSYCVLLSEDVGNVRLHTMVETTDGFEIAKRDLELRGTGQILGIRQSGADRLIELMLENPEIYKTIRSLTGERVRRREERKAALQNDATGKSKTKSSAK